MAARRDRKAARLDGIRRSLVDRRAIRIRVYYNPRRVARTVT